MTQTDHRTGHRSAAIAVGLLLTAIPTTSVLCAQDAVQWRIEDGGNGHWYEFVVLPEILSWDDAQLAAQERGGHLVTFTSETENAFISVEFNGQGSGQAWIGLVQDTTSIGYSEPDGGWGWVTGEPLSWINWATGALGGEPNNGGSTDPREEWGNIWFTGGDLSDDYIGTWNDNVLLDPDRSDSYIIEWSDDCNGDGIVDYGQILDGTLADENGNGVPDICDALDLNGDGTLDADQLMVALPRSIGSNRTLGDITVDALGTVFAGNNNNTGGSIFRITGLNAPVAYGPSLSDPDTVCMNEGPIFSEFPETTILIGREDRITALNTDDSTVDVLSGGSAFDNINALHVGADGRLGWVALTPNPIQRSTWSDGSVSTFGLLDWDCLSATNDAEGRTWFNEGTKIVRSDGDPATDHVDIGTCVLPVAFKAGLGEALSGGVLVLDRDQLRWIDTETLEELQILDLAGLPELPEGLLNDSVDRYIAINGANDHVVISIVKSDGANPGASEYAMYDLFLSTDDCDENGELDWRQIARDGSLDSDGSAVLDVCEQPGGYDGILDVPSEYATIQEAVDNAPAGGIIEVGPGTYDRFDLTKDGLTIRSTDGPGATRITTEFTGSGLWVDGTTTNTTLQGFEFHRCRHGINIMFGASLTISDCWFTENQENNNGGAISMPGGSILTGCLFSSNSTQNDGGAIHITGGTTTIESCTFTMNTASAWNGGAIGLTSGATLISTDCRFEENSAGGAGAIDGRSGSHLEATRCIFIRNQASSSSTGAAHGGGCYMHQSSALIKDSLFLENTSAGHAGAIITYIQPVEIRRSYFIRNEGVLSGNTFLVNSSALTMSDSTVCDDAADWVAYQGGGSLQGPGNTITQTCSIDDCNGDGVTDIIQILDGTLEDCNKNAIPDTCELTDTLVASVDRTPDGPTDFIEFDVSTLGDAGGEVSLRLSALGELAATGEFMYVYLDDDLLGLAFSTDGLDCEEVVADFIITPSEWNQAGLDDTRLIRISGLGIDPDACADPRTAIEVTVPLVVTDCNANGTWDECEPDGDGDGTIDACDDCPTDPLKTEAGACGCGVEDTDTDADGTPDCLDDCPDWPGACSEDGQTLFVAIGESIQTAIGVVPEGGVVVLSEGVFLPQSTLDAEGKALTLRGAVDTDGYPTTILDGQQTRRLVKSDSGEGPDTIFENLVLQNGKAEGSFPENAGGGMLIQGSSPGIVNCMFIDNAAGGGGGMYILEETDTETAPTLTGCRFEGNSTGGDGGGLCCFGDCAPVLSDCVFVDNFAGFNGGGLYSVNSTPALLGCSFESNIAAGSGGGIHSAQSSSEITGCTFVENTALYGGAMTCLLGTETVTIDGSTFTQNIGNQTTGVQGGGGIHLGSTNSDLSGLLTVTNSDFTLNQSIWGAAVRVLSARAEFTDCSFDDNGLETSGTGPGSLDGGAFHVRDNSVVNITRCTATGNETEGRGAFLLAIYGSDVAIIDSVITGNTGLAGGGLTVGIDTEASTMDVGGSRICNNSLSQIDGIYTDLGGNCITETCDSDLDGTFDCVDGCPDDPEKIEPGDCGCGFPETDTDGDLIPDCVDDCPDWPYGCTEDGQTLVVLDGEPLAIALSLVPDGGTLELGPGTFRLTGSLDPGGKAVTFQGSFAEDGSLATTIDARGNGSVLVFQSGEGPDTQVRDLILTGGSATYGGGIECSNGSSPSIIGCLIVGNTATEYGGAINCYLDCNPLIEDCILTGNTATIAGGGCSTDQSTPRIVGCLIEGNDAPTGGGLYFSESGDARLEGSSVCGNTTDQVDGPYDDAGTNCILDDCGSDLDQNGLPDACDPDCDGDGEPDAWEIESGQALDCNENGVPDACDLETGVAIDCDTNGIPDACDIADGAEDDNANGELDVCELARGDFDLDGCIGGADLAILLSLWGLENPPIGDFNDDGTVGGADLAVLLANWDPCG